MINQIRYSILDRWIENDGLKTFANKSGCGLIAFSPLAQGLLSDRYLHGIPEDSRIRKSGTFLDVYKRQTVMGNIDSMDWKDYGAKTILRTVMEDKELQGGSIIRLNSEAKYTKEALPKLIESLEREGFRLVPLSQLLYEEAYHLDVKGRQIPDDR